MKEHRSLSLTQNPNNSIKIVVRMFYKYVCECEYINKCVSCLDECIVRVCVCWKKAIDLYKSYTGNTLKIGSK